MTQLILQGATVEMIMGVISDLIAEIVVSYLLPEVNHSGDILNSGANSQIELNLWLHSLCKMHTKPKGIVPVKNEPSDFGL